ncbi:hypothetical protein ACJX0J_041921, partial [Zea mays]
LRARGAGVDAHANEAAQFIARGGVPVENLLRLKREEKENLAAYPLEPACRIPNTRHFLLYQRDNVTVLCLKPRNQILGKDEFHQNVDFVVQCLVWLCNIREDNINHANQHLVPCRMPDILNNGDHIGPLLC